MLTMKEDPMLFEVVSPSKIRASDSGPLAISSD